MREILFKGKTTKKPIGVSFNNTWVEGNLIKSSGRYYIHPLCNMVSVKNEIGKIIIMHEVQPETICQYTGVNDKDGNKIFENDILIAHLDEEYADDTTYEQVIWYKSGYCTKEQDSVDIEPLDDFTTNNFAVCGNIFDNPDLMK